MGNNHEPVLMGVAEASHKARWGSFWGPALKNLICPTRHLAQIARPTGRMGDPGLRPSSAHRRSQNHRDRSGGSLLLGRVRVRVAAPLCGSPEIMAKALH
ncbi:hypothetical protein SKAU_G00365860 [Synaphobranchus kaupii]|uniref:Uncharacterized protein n=1 Tax=Synaphobranchus kaupii TaxID=118154 RepID=A0A9Q1IEI2_SYNKA|nr:hypothetical protein SKAU_G00365860 [Synaphobranchus kaupii]